MGFTVETTFRAPRYNRRRGSGNIRDRSNLNNRVGRGGGVYVDHEFNWFGGQVENDVDTALIEAMDMTIDLAVGLTKLPGWTPFKTGDLQDSIQKLQITARKNRIMGDFGSHLHYALFQELGTYNIAPNRYLTRAGLQAGAQYLRIAADRLQSLGYR